MLSAKTELSTNGLRTSPISSIRSIRSATPATERDEQDRRGRERERAGRCAGVELAEAREDQ